MFVLCPCLIIGFLYTCFEGEFALLHFAKFGWTVPSNFFKCPVKVRDIVKSGIKADLGNRNTGVS